MGIFLTELMRFLNELETKRAGKSGYHIFDAFNKIANNADIAAICEFVFKAMQKATGEATLDDSAAPLRPIFSQLNEYRDILVTPQYGANVFERRARTFEYVRPDYLLQPEIVSTFHRIYARLNPS